MSSLLLIHLSLISEIGEHEEALNYVTADDNPLANDPAPEDIDSDTDIDINPAIVDDPAIDIECENEEEGEHADPPSVREAIEAMETLTRFYHSDNFISQIDFDRLQTSFCNKVMSLKYLTLITDLFGKE